VGLATPDILVFPQIVINMPTIEIVITYAQENFLTSEPDKYEKLREDIAETIDSWFAVNAEQDEDGNYA
jgi:hypothetical protein